MGIDYSSGDIVSSMVITMYGARWILEEAGGPLCNGHDFLTTVLCNRNQYRIS